MGRPEVWASDREVPARAIAMDTAKHLTTIHAIMLTGYSRLRSFVISSTPLTVKKAYYMPS
jgi:hypothetical protein